MSRAIDSPSEAGFRGASAASPGGMVIVLALAVAKLLAHLLNTSRYGIFRDELYYLACAEHLDWGYVDQPPLIAVVTYLVRHTLGDSLLALRLLPAVAGAAKVILAGLLARALGGGRFAQGLAALAVLVAPGFLGIDHILTMNAFEPLFWMGGALLVIRWIQTRNDRLWLWFGALMGLALLNKQTTLVFGLSVLSGLLATPARATLRKPGIWLGGLIAFLIFLPNLVWMARHDFPMLELLANIRRSGRNVSLHALAFFGEQAFFSHPLAVPIWIVGLLWLLATRDGRPYRCLGWTFVVLQVVFFVTGGRIYYPAPIFPLVFAAGGVALEKFFSAGGRARAFAKPAYVALLAATGVALAPLMLPVLPEETFIRYTAALGFGVPKLESHKMGPLPQIYADMHGWAEMAQTVARVYHALPPEEQRKAAIFGGNYGEAGAVDFFGPKLGLPKAISGHQNYFLWGPRGATGEVVIVLGAGDRKNLESKFASVEEATVLHDAYAMPYENRPVYICRGLKWNLRDVWPKVKNWD